MFMIRHGTLIAAWRLEKGKGFSLMNDFVEEHFVN